MIKRSNSNAASLNSPGGQTDIQAVLLDGAVEGDTGEEHAITDATLGVVVPYCDGDQGYFSSAASVI